MEPKWLSWAKEIQAIAQTGLAYAKDVYDVERYQALRELSVDILANYTLESKESIRLSFANDEGYCTPKTDIRGVVFRDQCILLVREKSDGKWALPGGWADIGLSPSEVVVKEIREESGFETEAVRLLAVMDKKFHNHPPEAYHIYKLFILCQIVGGEAVEGLETSDVSFFAEDELPELSLERNTVEQLHTMFQYLQNSAKPVILD
ncbi:MAG: NUDIX hydrolase [Paenibacillus sp.]|nr:NUDIX hydrolase [Paenibacillus sp.]